MKKYVMQCIRLGHRVPPFLGMGFTSSEFQTMGIRTYNETRVLTEHKSEALYAGGITPASPAY